MKEISLSVNGNLKEQKNSIMQENYYQLFNYPWKGKLVWEHIRDGNLTSAPSFTGMRYHEDGNFKIMIVGRAVNGWEVQFEDCSSLEKTVHSILYQENRLDDFAKDYIIDENDKKYYYAKSPFLRMMRTLVEKMNGTSVDWQQRIVWSNLYKIAPRHGGNPSWLLLRDNLSTYIEVLKEEIIKNRPELVVFVTDNNFFDPYPNNSKYSSFYSLFEAEGLKRTELPEYICASGQFVENSAIKMIVCQRPEKRPIAKIVDNIYTVYTDVTRK